MTFAVVIVSRVGHGPTETASSPSDPKSIAVLPLENLSGDPEQEYFADGMTDMLITDLGTISALRVISRTSVMQYKGARKPLPEIARELDVSHIVEGGEAREILDGLLERSQQRPVSSDHFARVYVGLGDKDRAVDSLEKAYNDRAPGLTYLQWAPFWDPLRSHPRFQALLKKMNFPELAADQN